MSRPPPPRRLRHRGPQPGRERLRHGVRVVNRPRRGRQWNGATAGDQQFVRTISGHRPDEGCSRTRTGLQEVPARPDASGGRRRKASEAVPRITEHLPVRTLHRPAAAPMIRARPKIRARTVLIGTPDARRRRMIDTRVTRGDDALPLLSGAHTIRTGAERPDDRAGVTTQPRAGRAQPPRVGNLSGNRTHRGPHDRSIRSRTVSHDCSPIAMTRASAAHSPASSLRHEPPLVRGHRSRHQVRAATPSPDGRHYGRRGYRRPCLVADITLLTHAWGRTSAKVRRTVTESPK